MLDIVSGYDLVSPLGVLVPETAPAHSDATIEAFVKTAQSLEECKGKDGSDFPYIENGTRIFLAGIGDAPDAECHRKAAGRIVKSAMKARQDTVSIAVPDLLIEKDAEPLLQAILEGAVLANHVFDRFKDAKIAPVSTIRILVPESLAKKAMDLAERVEAVCTATIMARDLVTIPSNCKRPEMLVKLLVDAFKAEGLKVRVLEKKDLEALGMKSMLEVAKGSDQPPAMVIAEYAPENPEKTVALVGKGVTFDSGGLDLKPPTGMEFMKSDMGGAAAVAGTTIALARLKPGFRVVTAIPIVENMPSGSAYRPGDVIESHAGKTIEVLNTDAEGRLILNDALSYMAKTETPDLMIDVATLTGACMLALGDHIAGVFTPDMGLAHQIADSGNRTHERCWPMPMPEDYKKLLKSDIADLRNIGTTRNGGAITAALFLQEFVGETRWAHIDIAGTALAKKASDYCPVGGTGFGVRVLVDFLTRN